MSSSVARGRDEALACLRVDVSSPPPSFPSPPRVRSSQWKGSPSRSLHSPINRGRPLTAARSISPPLHRFVKRDGSQSCPKPSSEPLFVTRERPTTSSGRISPSDYKSLASLSYDDLDSSPSKGFKPTRTQPSPAAATTKSLHKAEFQRNIAARSNYWKKYRVIMPHSTSHDVLALTYKDRKRWNDKHNVDACLTHLTKSEYEIFWKWFTDRLHENFPSTKNYMLDEGGSTLNLDALADDFVRHGVFPDRNGALSLLERVDIDRNGKVSYREFVASMTAVNENLEEVAILRKFIFSLKSNMERQKRTNKKDSVTKRLNKMIRERKMAAALVVAHNSR